MAGQSSPTSGAHQDASCRPAGSKISADDGADGAGEHAHHLDVPAQVICGFGEYREQALAFLATPEGQRLEGQFAGRRVHQLGGLERLLQAESDDDDDSSFSWDIEEEEDDEGDAEGTRTQSGCFPLRRQKNRSAAGAGTLGGGGCCVIA